MPTYIALLRGINVGGRNTIPMAELRALCRSLGFAGPRTLLQSGNLVFTTGDAELTSVQARLEAGIGDAFGFEIPVILRRPAAFRATLERQPWTAEQLRQPKKLVVVFLSEAPGEQALDELRRGNPGPERMHAAGDALYVFYAAGQARSRLTGVRIERALDIRATARNWNTCNRILKLLDEAAPQGS